MNQAVYYTASDLAKRGLEQLPDELASNRHLIYSSPATLAFNSPGAEGFGVKRRKAEYDDLAKIAEQSGRSLRDVREAVEKELE